MKNNNLIFATIFIASILACNNKSKVETTTVELVSIKHLDSPTIKPPPQPSSVFMTLQDWLLKICDTENPGSSIIAYHFGIFETQIGYTVYLTGSKEFDKDDSDWVLNDDFEPVQKYCPLPPDEYKNLKWEQVLNRIKSQLKDFTKTEKFRKSFFSKAKAITTGFDDGDLVRIK
jgi:hypothetical protein